MLNEVWMDTHTGPAFLVGMLSNAQAETLVENLREEGIKAWIG
ncbi:hypothetical protein SEA_SUPERCALLIE99_92 [Mycobacterium phage SuperCallie99]|uniref:Uncharacterized protein n=6 Tax=Gladiatorvirus TaxID=2948726 RepID=A0A1C9LYZ6_9CAUD|nr:hypothetical protein X821_gp015 [Mycobacterium phage Zaka]YP_009014587.1 hypothetical protein CL99_gp016 [Mycobacterium phage Blue7]YP_009635588.1 hypothetical protein FGG54_gp14 [Mycobacterium phage Gladiator]YP_009636613.1 hypothetical protein FGG22_gp018 [Mycobacterium phage Hammer]ANT42279.1 hypothetical protein SEA_TONETONE_94 [Mycobacterium phage ToneTone]AOQ28112.1 hypothetical protein SEA_GRUUNAGA_98 [Mycobacterium phage Gruunaga]ASZ74568.1 hypothetical protein SEA_WIKS_97 [Mycobac